MIKIEKIKNNEIYLFADDSKFANWENIPISKYRALSYSQNPRSDSQDIVLYLAYLDEKLVGYRAIMPDLVFIGNTQIKVGWLSGNWVHEDFRRKGIASLLFNEAYNDWGKRLMYTNYALESKAVYDKSEKFELLSSKKGKRFYLKSCLASLLPIRSIVFKKSIFALKAFDFIVNLLNPIPFIVGRMKFESSIELEYLSYPDSDCFELFERDCALTLNHRSRTELQWIFDYPWLVSSPQGDLMGEKYFFSSNPKIFSQSIVKVFKNKNLLGFFMFNLNDDKLSIPYCSFDPKDSELIAKLVLIQAIKLKVSMITVYETSLVAAMKRRWLNRLLSKNRNQNYYATMELINQINSSQAIFRDGDGDCAFI